MQVLKCGFVRCDQTGTRAAFDGHVADRHAAFHRQIANGFTGIFDDMAGAAGGADLADDGEDQVLRGAALRQRAIDSDAHVLKRALQQRLRGHHMLDLGRADAEGQRAERTMGRRMAIAANDGRTRQSEALFRDR